MSVINIDESSFEESDQEKSSFEDDWTPEPSSPEIFEYGKQVCIKIFFQTQSKTSTSVINTDKSSNESSFEESDHEESPFEDDWTPEGFADGKLH